MLRKHLLTQPPKASAPPFGAKDIAAIATVWVTSEATDAPIDQAFDQRRGPGGSRWVAAAPGEQRLILAFDTPQTIRTISLEIEEPEVSHTQVLHVFVSRNGGQTYQELRRQEYTFSPPGTTFEREEWTVTVEGVTHLQLVITPDKGGNPAGPPLHPWSSSEAAIPWPHNHEIGRPHGGVAQNSRQILCSCLICLGRAIRETRHASPLSRL